MACSGPGSHDPSSAEGDYIVNVLVLTVDSGIADEISGHFRQNWNLTTKVSVMDAPPRSANQFDCIYVARDFSAYADYNFPRLGKFLTSAARKGALVYMESESILHGLESVIGVKNVGKVDPVEVQPFLTGFPPIMGSLESFFMGIIPGLPAKERSHYEQTHLPRLVETKPETATWPTRYQMETTSASVMVSSSAGQPLATWRPVGSGGILWTVDFSRRNEDFHGIPVRRDFRLGFPDPDAVNFHFGRAGMDYLFRDLLVDLAAKLKYGLSIRRVAGPNGAPSCSWQNHLDAYDNWRSEYAIRWSDMLIEHGLIPSFTVRSDLTQFERESLRNSRPGALKFAEYCEQHGIPANLHLTFEPLDSPDTERDKIKVDIAGLVDIGVDAQNITGADHHVFYTHASPVWQSFYTELKAGLYHDFGGATLSNFDLFPYFFCTSAAYLPYCPPFFLESITGAINPMVIWSPTAAFPYSQFSNFRYFLPEKLRMPVTQYVHPEFILESDTVDDLHPEFQGMIAEMEWLRDEKGYCPLTEPQAARAFIANRTANITATIHSDEIRIQSKSDSVFSQAGEFKHALGIRIETVPLIRPITAWHSSGLVQHSDGTSLETSLNQSGETIVQLNTPPGDGFKLDRINVPFVMESTDDSIRLEIREPGLRWIRYSHDPAAGSGWLPDPGPMRLRSNNHWLELTDAGNEPLEITFRKYTGEAWHRELNRRISTIPVDASTREIDFGTPESRELYGKGWCIIDEFSAGRTVTWSSGYLYSELDVILTDNVDIDAAITVHPYQVVNKEPQMLMIQINGAEILPETRLEPGWQTLRFEISRQMLNNGINHVVFQYKTVGFPGLDNPDVYDYRPLSVMFDRLVFHRKPMKVNPNEK